MAPDNSRPDPRGIPGKDSAELSETARWSILHHLEEVRAWNRISYEADARIAATGIAVASVALALTVNYGAAVDAEGFVAWVTVLSSLALVVSVACGVLSLREQKHRIDLRAKIYDGDFWQARVRHGLPAKPDQDADSWPTKRIDLKKQLDKKHFRWDWGQYAMLIVGFLLLVSAAGHGAL